jgi:hypothetical protein
MTSLFDKLNLRPQERRLVVIVGIVVFAAVNFWLIIPMFGDYGRYERRIVDANAKLKTYQDEIAKKAEIEAQLKLLESQGGFVPTEEAGLRLSTEVSSQASLSGVTLTSITQMQRNQSGGKTNAFFDEAAVTVNFNTTEKELIDFLWRLADREMLIRAKSMTVATDPSRQRLQGNITLVKSFQRRPPPRASPVAAAAAAAAKSTPAASPTNKPAVAPPSATRPVVTPSPTTKPAATASTGAPPGGASKQGGPGKGVTAPARPTDPAPIPTPPSGGTNRPRRSLPTPAKP